MLVSSELEQFAGICSQIGNRIASPTGFVSVNTLLREFNAELVVRPLLVEAMLATAPPTDSDSIGNRWMVLVDSDKHGVTHERLMSESQEDALPVRFRNTVAHELVHSIPFDLTKHGIRLNRKLTDKQSFKELVEDVEKETEKLSPLLLIPERGLKDRLVAERTNLAAQTVLALLRHFATSREVLIHRLLLLRNLGDKHGLLEYPGLRNTAIGIAEWRRDGKVALRKWPLFTNFDRQQTPDFLLLTKQQDFVSVQSFHPEGEHASDEALQDFSFDAPTVSMSRDKAARTRIHFSTEPAKKTVGRQFLFAARKVA